jgi:hypothetical protein
MAITYGTDVRPLYATNVGNDANYSAPGNYGLNSTQISSTAEQDTTLLIEVIRAFLAASPSAAHTKLAKELMHRMLEELNTGVGFSASTNASRARDAAMRYLAGKPRSASL